MGLCFIWGLKVYFEKNSQTQILEAKISKNLEEIQKLRFDNQNQSEIISKTTLDLGTEIVEKQTLVKKSCGNC